jgi:cell division initiation protein
MKITPIEIRQKTFEKHFRGYDKEEVNAFLITLSQEWEKVIDENKEYRFRLDAAEKEIKKLREVENSLYKTLKTAEDTGATLIAQAQKTAELNMKESQMKAEVTINDAKMKAKSIIEEAESRARTALEDMQNELRDLERHYKNLEAYRDNLISDLKHFSGDLNEKINRAYSQIKRMNFDIHLKDYTIPASKPKALEYTSEVKEETSSGPKEERVEQADDTFKNVYETPIVKEDPIVAPAPTVQHEPDEIVEEKLEGQNVPVEPVPVTKVESFIEKEPEKITSKSFFDTLDI